MAVRTIRREPAFFLAVSAVLALGIGATTAVYSILQPTLFEPLPYPDPDRVVRVAQTRVSWQGRANPVLANMADDYPVEWGVLLDWRRLNRSFSALGVHRAERFVFNGGGEPRWVLGQQASSGVFEALGVGPALGRVFTAEDDVAGAEPTAILSHGLWVTEYGADPGAVGRAIELTGIRHRIIGVMPAGFYFPTRDTRLWTRLGDRYLAVYDGGQSLDGIARLAPIASIESATADMAEVSERIGEERASRAGEYGVRLWPQHNYLIGDVRPTMALLLGAAAGVLLIACANASGLLLIRAKRREREFALRRCLGVPRLRLVGQILTETLLVASMAGVAALGVTHFTLSVLRTLAPPGILTGVRSDAGVVATAVVLSIGCGFLVAALPMIGAALGVAPTGVPRSRTSSVDRRVARFQRSLVFAEVALTVPLVVATGLLGQSLLRLSSVDLGFEPAGLYAVSTEFYGERYDDAEAIRAFRQTLGDRLAVMPGAIDVSVAFNLPYSEGGSGGDVRVGDDVDASPVNVKWTRVGRSYFSTIDVAMLEGRTFEPADVDADGGVAIVNRAMAERFWPGGGAVGSRIRREGDVAGREVIGVADDLSPGTPSRDATALVYLPTEDGPLALVRTSSGAAETNALIENAVSSLDPSLPVRIVSLEDRVRDSSASERFRALVIGLFATLAATLAVVGVASVLSYWVVEQRRELGVRMALGATRARIVRRVLLGGLAVVAPGLLVGVGAVFAGTGLVEGFLFQTSAGDPVTLLLASAAIVFASLGVALLPAIRASRSDPSVVLGAE
ncbi:MAG: ABC transporter permease [Gemmatimonadota bacterium]